MAMSSATLSTQLQAMTPTGTEAIANQRFVDAWAVYFAASAANGVPYSAVAAHKAAMLSAMSGSSAPGAAASKIQAGVAAWWASLVSTFAATYSGSIALTPPVGITALTSNLSSIFASNTAVKRDLAASCAAVAGILHSANLGGTATFPPAVVAPIA